MILWNLGGGFAWQCSAESERGGVEEHPLRRSGVYLSYGALG
jgi:hypothetical protein